MSQPYLSIEALLHDAFWEEEDPASEVALMSAFLKKYPGPALEIGAGSGRLMFPLVKLGHEVEGLEISPDMLSLARERSRKLGITASIHHGDMNSWRPKRKFSALLAPAFTFQLTSDPEATLQHWASILDSCGGLYLTIFMPYAELLGDLPENQWYQDHRATLPDGRTGLLETRHHIDHRHQLLHREHRYQISGNPPQTHNSRQTIRWFDHPDLLALLQKCGFHTDHFFLDFDPRKTTPNPEDTDFDGILTYHCTRL